MFKTVSADVHTGHQRHACHHLLRSAREEWEENGNLGPLEDVDNKLARANDYVTGFGNRNRIENARWR